MNAWQWVAVWFLASVPSALFIGAVLKDRSGDYPAVDELAERREGDR